MLLVVVCYYYYGLFHTSPPPKAKVGYLSDWDICNKIMNLLLKSKLAFLIHYLFETF